MLVAAHAYKTQPPRAVIDTARFNATIEEDMAAVVQWQNA